MFSSFKCWYALSIVFSVFKIASMDSYILLFQSETSNWVCGRPDSIFSQKFQKLFSVRKTRRLILMQSNAEAQLCKYILTGKLL